MIVIQSLSLTAKFEGVLMDYVSKTGRVLTEATNGTIDETYTRATREYDITVSECDLDNYRILQNIFMFENTFSINDTAKNIIDKEFIIDANTFKLNETEDKSNKTFLYSGSIPVRRI